ncbi:MAG TPA: deoxyguanosinetriphosphate triphosphohydrolase [Vicinamibacteria bacterium]|nr:deoxyguanosinetriphosphate triphosphohydrolase [Vicinamibacteria bacterium]
MPDRRVFEELEASRLAPYAASSASSKGREHPEPEHAFRTAFQRDRDRIIHCTAFRRLEYKTQVFVNHEGDHYRTRLTHSLEAAQIARTMARYLRLNEDLTESVTLAHDLGHTPFGHAGEDAMNALMKGHGGFEHNLQSLRIVDRLERRYPGFDGLNLSFEVREGILKHSPRHLERGPEEFKDGLMPTLEAQLVDEADEIAYANHDLEDGLTSRLLDLEALRAVELWREHFDEAGERFPGVPRKIRIRAAIRGIINHLTTDLLGEVERRLHSERIESIDDVRHQSERLVQFTPPVATQKALLKQFLFANLYRHFRVVRMAEKAKRVVGDLFQAYAGNPRQLPPHVLARVDEEGLERVVCDYIAGMTDRFALDEHRKLFDPHDRV